MKKLFYFFTSLIPLLSMFSLAQDATPKLETILGNQFQIAFMPSYTHDKAKGSDGVAISKKKPDFIPDIWDRIKFVMKYDKILWQARVVLASGDHGKGYSLKFDRGYLKYSPIDEITFEVGMDGASNTTPGALSGNNDEVGFPLVEGGLGNMTSGRNIGLWLFYHPTKDLTVTPYIIAPKTAFGSVDATGKFTPTPGVTAILSEPSAASGTATATPLFTTDSTERYKTEDTKKVPNFGLALEGYFLDKSIYLAGFYETSFLASHQFFGTANLDKKDAWHSAFFLEGTVTLGQYNVARQRSMGLGTGYIGYFGPDNRHEVQIEYVANFENPNADGKLYKTSHNAARTTADNLDHQLQNMYYDLHSISLEGKFRAYAGDQLFFVVGVAATFAGKKLGAIRKKDDGTLIAPINIQPQFSIQSFL